MELVFTKNDSGSWYAEFEVTADFNLHIEGVAEGNVRVYQRSTPDGEYADVRGATPYPSFGHVYDFDFAALIYPKYIKVVCPNEPTKAEITCPNGEVNQIFPPVPTIKFKIARAYDSTEEYEAEVGMTWEKWVASDYNTGGYSLNGDYICRLDSAFSDFYAYVYLGDKNITAKETIIEGETYSDGSKQKELITFYIKSEEYQAEKGMTWKQWEGSSYDKGKWRMGMLTIVDNDNLYGIYDENGWLFGIDGGQDPVIVEGYVYRTDYAYKSEPSDWN